jgi:hypothetical protein
MGVLLFILFPFFLNPKHHHQKSPWLLLTSGLKTSIHHGPRNPTSVSSATNRETETRSKKGSGIARNSSFSHCGGGMMNPVCKGESDLKVESAESLQVQCPIACGERFVSTRLDSSSLSA